MSDDQYRDALLQLRAWGQKRAVDQCLEDFGVDVIIGPADSRIHELSTAAGKSIFLHHPFPDLTMYKAIRSRHSRCHTQTSMVDPLGSQQ
jgi:hypothetical protein